MSTEAITKLREHLATIDDVHGAASLLGWDQQTKMPPAGARIRAQRQATIGRIAHEMFVSGETAGLLEGAEGGLSELDPESDDACLIRETRRTFDRESVIPSDLLTEAILASSEGYTTWIEARKNSDFASFLPALQRVLDVNLRFVEAYRTLTPDAAEDYDLLLENYEPGLTSKEIAAVFDVVRERTIPLVEQVRENAGKVDDSIVHGEFPSESQEELSLKVLRQVGFDDESWRLDVTHHPFATTMGTADVRITTRYLPDYFSSAFFSGLHEFGHGLYERQSGASLERTPIAGGVSMAWHESQSRMWENLVGRGRPFWDWAIGPTREVFPEAFNGATADDLYRAVNRFQPSLIRVEADELTYNLHIILRFELEREMLDGNVALKDLPEVWNQRMRDYLGVEVPGDAEGVLQDVHWSSGLFGYFPTYALGNVLSLQLWNRITSDIPDLEDGFRRGEFEPLRTWLGENVHAHGSKFLPKDLMERVLGTRTLDPGPLTEYLESKVSELYG